MIFFLNFILNNPILLVTNAIDGSEKQNLSMEFALQSMCLLKIQEQVFKNMIIIISRYMYMYLPQTPRRQSVYDARKKKQAADAAARKIKVGTVAFWQEK